MAQARQKRASDGRREGRHERNLTYSYSKQRTECRRSAGGDISSHIFASDDVLVGAAERRAEERAFNQ